MENSDLYIKIFIKGSVFLVLLIIGLVYYIKNSRKPMFINKSGSLIDVPVVRGSMILKFIPWMSFFRNNINPKLFLYGDKFEYKIFNNKEFFYSDIEVIKIMKILGSTNLQLLFRDSIVGCSFEISQEDFLVMVLNKFKEKKCQLSYEAEDELNKLMK